MKQLGPQFYIRNTIFAGLLGLGLLFSNCSEVNFDTLPSTDQVGDLGGGDGGNPLTPILPPDPNNGSDPNGNNPTYGRLQSFTSERPRSKVDILLVVDTSGSMSPELTQLAERLDGFVAGLQSRNLDWQLCFTQTGVNTTSSAGLALNWLQPIGTGYTQSQIQILNPGTADYSNIFRTTMQNIRNVTGVTNSGDEQGLSATYLALANNANRDCFRPDAALSTIVISDEDERSCGGRCLSQPDYPTLTGRGLSNYTGQYRALENANRASTVVARAASALPGTPFSFHSIVIREGDLNCYHAQDQSSTAFVGVEYSRLSRLTGGTIGDICSSNYANQLTEIAARIQASMTSVTLNCVPVGPVSVAYTPTLTNVSASTSGDKVFFSSEIPVGTRIDVRYSCQQDIL